MFADPIMTRIGMVKTGSGKLVILTGSEILLDARNGTGVIEATEIIELGHPREAHHRLQHMIVLGNLLLPGKLKNEPNRSVL